MQDILINASASEVRVAVVSNAQLEDIRIERQASRGFVGNIYMGRVVRVLPGMQSAFIDVGLERTGFLHVADIENARLEDGSYKPIEKILTEGQRLIVQVAKDPIGTKGPRLTTTVSLAGHVLVYLPLDPHIGVSQRIEDAQLRESLRERLTALKSPEEKGGYIVRTCAEEGAEDANFIADMQYLSRLWKEIKEKAYTAPMASILYRDLDLAHRVIRDMISPDTGHIYVDSETLYNDLRTFAQHYVPDAETLIGLYSADKPLFELYGVDDEIEKALSRRVDMKSGGYLIVDQTEAMTTIDVNTGGFVGKKDFSQTVFKTNLEAAQTIARQLRLRNLGGIIIIDFIDMSCHEHRAAVLAELKRAIIPDRTRITVSDFTELGLVEMTRKRTRESLSHVLCETCPVCAGRGQIRTAKTVCYTIMREIIREARQYKEAKSFKILASQSVIDMFLEDESQAFDLLQEAISHPVTLEVEKEYSQEDYDVIIY